MIIITVTDIVSTKMTNTIATNVASTASTNCHSKQKRLLYFAYLFVSNNITIDKYYCFLLLSKTKRSNIESKIMNLKILKTLRVNISMT